MALLSTGWEMKAGVGGGDQREIWAPCGPRQLDAETDGRDWLGVAINQAGLGCGGAGVGIQQPVGQGTLNLPCQAWLYP